MRLSILLLVGLLGSPTVVMAEPQEVTLKVKNMYCPVCPVTVKKALKKVDTVEVLDISYDTQIARVRYDDEKAKVDDLIAATTNAGYPSLVVQ